MSDGGTRRIVQVRPEWHPLGPGREILTVTQDEYQGLVGTQADTGEYFVEPDNDSVREILNDRANQQLAETVEGRTTIGTAGRAALDTATFGISEWAINSLADDEELERDAWEEQRARDPLANLGGALGGALTPWGAPGLLATGTSRLVTSAVTRALYGNALAAAGRTRTAEQILANIAIGQERLAQGATAGEIGMIRAPAIIAGRAIGEAAGETIAGTADIAAQSEDEGEFWTNLAIVAGLGLVGGAAAGALGRGVTRATRLGGSGGRAGRGIADVDLSSGRRSITEITEEVGGSAERALSRALRDIDRSVEPSVGARLAETLGWGRQRRGVLSGEEIATADGLRGAQRFNNAADEVSGRLGRVISEAEDTIRASIGATQRSITDLGRSAAARSANAETVGTIRDAVVQLADSIGIPGAEDAARAIARSSNRGSDSQLTSILRFRENVAGQVVNGSTPAIRARATQALGQIDALISNPTLGEFGKEVAKGIERLNVLNRNLGDINKVFGSGDDIVSSLQSIAKGAPREGYERILADIFSDTGRRRIWGDRVPAGIDDAWQDAMDLERANLWARSKADINGRLGIGDVVERGRRGATLVGALAGGSIGALKGAAIDLAPGVARFAFDPFFRVALMERYLGSLQSVAKRMNVAGRGIKDSMRGTTMVRGYAGLAAMRAAAGTEERRNTLQSIFLGDSREDKEAAYNQILNRLDSISQSPLQLMDMLERENQGLQEFGPQATSRVVQAQIQQIATLKSLVPPTSDQRFLLPGMQKLPPNEAELDKLLEAAAVIDDPVFALEMLANGVLSNNAARALERGFPELYGNVVGDVFAEYSNMIRDGEDPNYQYVNQLSILLGMPLDPSHDAQMIYRLQQNGAQTAEQERTIRSREVMTRQVSNRIASQYETESQRLNT